MLHNIQWLKIHRFTLINLRTKGVQKRDFVLLTTSSILVSMIVEH